MNSTGSPPDPAFARAIADQLTATGTTFRRNVYLHGITVDFLVSPTPRRRILLEVKDWEPSHENIERAATQARLIKSAGKVEEAYLVLTKLRSATSTPGVIAMSEIGEVLGKVEPAPASRNPAPVAFANEDPLRLPERTVFAAMPFAGEYDDVYFVAMAFAAEQAEAVVRRTDKESFEGDIVARVHELIRQSVAVVADISECRPSVMYEVGYAHALDRPTILICSTRLEELPFDVRNWNVLPYVKGKTFELREKLAKRLSAAIR